MIRNALILAGVLCLSANAQIGDLLGNPTIEVTITHPAGLGMQAKRVAFGAGQGQCSAELIDKIVEDFVGNQVEVVDREHLTALLAEHQLALSGYIDTTRAAEIGKILGPAALVFVKVSRCESQQDRLSEDRKTYDKNRPVVRVSIARTRSFFKATVQTVDLATGRVFAVKTIDADAGRQNESPTGRPEFPAEFDVRDVSLQTASAQIHRLFFPWTETKKLIFFDDKEATCNLKSAYQLLKAGDQLGTLQASEDNLETCRALTTSKPKTAGHAYYNLGMAHFILNDFTQAIENFREAAKLRPGDIVNQAIAATQEAQQYADTMRAQEDRMAVEAAQTSAREQEKSAQAQASQPKLLTVGQVIAMKEAGLSEDLIAARIRKEGRPFDLSVEDMLALKKGGLSDGIIKVMLNPAAEFSQPPVPAAAAPAATPAPAAPAPARNTPAKK